MVKLYYRNITGLFIGAALSAVLLLTTANDTFAQPERRHLREGNREFRSGNYNESELSYRRATEIEKNNPLSWFNLGGAVYRQERFDEAVSLFEKNRNLSETPLQKAAGLYNMGNAYLNSGDLINSIEAYKSSLRLNPDNMQAKYNLAYAQDLLEEQQQQQEDESEADNSDEKQDQEDQKDQEGDDQSGNEENNENENETDEDESGSDKRQDNSETNREKQTEISPDDARRLLDAIAANEQKVLEDIARKNAAANRIRTLINW